MRNLVACVAFFVPFVSGPVVWAQEALPEAAVEKLKAATVYVRASLPGGLAMGSGFLMEKGPAEGYVVTNAHVVGLTGTLAQEVECVFFSGTDGERIKPARIVGFDRGRDLAVLVVQDEALPEPLDLKTKLRVRETLPVYVIGFPFGEQVFPGGQGPAATVSLGRVSSVRRDDHSRIVAIQIDGGINPGNSGGPVVDANGALVGIAVAKIGGTQIGLAIPATDLAEMLLGRVASLTTTQTGARDNRVEFAVSADLVDPKNVIRSVHFEAIRRDRLSAQLSPNPDGTWPPLAGKTQSFPLKVSSGKAEGKVVLEADNGQPTPYMFQVRYVCGNGKTNRMEPVQLVVTLSTPGVSPGVAVVPRPGPKRSLPKPKPNLSAGLELSELAGQRREIDLRGRFDNLEVGGAGRYFVFQSSERGELAIVDLNQLEVVKTLPVPIDAKIAAGLDRLLIAVPFDRKIEVWSLTQMKRTSTAIFPFQGTIKSLCFGSAANSPLLVHWAKSSDDLAQAFFSLMDPRSLKPLRVSGMQGTYVGQSRPVLMGPEGEFQLFLGMSYRDTVQIRAAAAGNAFGMWQTGCSPQGLSVLLLDGQSARTIYQHESPGHVVPSADGAVICTGRGYCTADLTQKAGEAWCLPTYDPRYLMLLTDTAGPGLSEPGRTGMRQWDPGGTAPRGQQMLISLWDRESGRPVHRFSFTAADGHSGEVVRNSTEKTLTADKRYHCIPQGKCLVVVPDSNDRLIVQKIDFDFGPEPRTWTDVSGKHQITASFLSLDDGQVRLRKEDGTEITLPLEKLSENDVAYIHSQEEEKARNQEQSLESAPPDTSPLPVPSQSPPAGAGTTDDADSRTSSGSEVDSMEVVEASVGLKGWTIREGSHMVGKADPPVGSPTQVGPFRVGQSLYVAFNLANMSNKTIRVSAGPNIVHANIGTIQTWIELLAQKPANATTPTGRAAGSTSGAAGGTMVSSPPVLRPGDVAVNGRWPLPPNLVAGHYRYTLEFRKTSGEVLQSESVEFDVLSEETK